MEETKVQVSNQTVNNQITETISPNIDHNEIIQQINHIYYIDIFFIFITIFIIVLLFISNKKQKEINNKIDENNKRNSSIIEKIREIDDNVKNLKKKEKTTDVEIKIGDFDIKEYMNNKFNDINNENKLSIEGLNQKIIKIKESLDIFESLSKSMKEQFKIKDEIIKKFEDGYEQRIHNNFIKELFILLDDLLLNEKINNNEIYEDLIDDILFILEKNNIYMDKSIIKNITYQGLEKEAEKNKKFIITEDENLDGKIAKIKNNCFYSKENDNKKIIQQAQVILFKYEKKIN